jgi:hypothetical protein
MITTVKVLGDTAYFMSENNVAHFLAQDGDKFDVTQKNDIFTIKSIDQEWSTIGLDLAPEIIANLAILADKERMSLSQYINAVLSSKSFDDFVKTFQKEDDDAFVV